MSVILSGCRQYSALDWYLSISEKPSNGIEFCLSLDPGCKGEAVRLYGINIVETDVSGAAVQTVWSLQNQSDTGSSYALQRLTYGITPGGWKVITPSQPLKRDVYYAFDGRFYFKQLRDGKFIVLPRKEFQERVAAKTLP
ncbi:MAG: hypothetical protein V4631_23255 [Pseudomonadota bacterium]